MRRCVRISLLVLLLARCAAAKCGNSLITVEGVIVGPNAGATISLLVSPDPNWTPQPAITIDAEGRFRATAYFDRTKSEGRRRDNCSRTPSTVTLELRKEDRIVGQTTLNISREFVRKNRIDYELRSLARLHSN
jgi:hypothetical protein